MCGTVNRTLGNPVKGHGEFFRYLEKLAVVLSLSASREFLLHIKAARKIRTKLSVGEDVTDVSYMQYL